MRDILHTLLTDASTRTEGAIEQIVAAQTKVAMPWLDAPQAKI